MINCGGVDGSAPEARYLRDFDPDWTPEGAKPPHRVTGRAWWTDDKAEAKRFADPLAAFAEWRRRSTVMPNRLPDMHPNRPLTAYTVSFETVEE